MCDAALRQHIGGERFQEAFGFGADARYERPVFPQAIEFEAKSLLVDRAEIVSGQHRAFRWRDYRVVSAAAFRTTDF